MSRAVFTEEVLAAIPGWVELGASRDEIAATLDTSVGSLNVTCSRAGISLTGGALRRGLDQVRWNKLRRAAAPRSMSASQLVRALIVCIVDDDLFNAVLDDGVTSEEDE